MKITILALLLIASFSQNNLVQLYDYIIIGAGMAGIGACGTLSPSKKNILVI
jgi:cation diffusion facilitator CzcD-associated flavoprotein CzcO